MVFESLLDPVFGPLLNLGPFWAILILSFAITLIINIVYLLVTDQTEMRKMKAKLKDYQKQIKEVQKKDPQKALSIQKKAMEINMKYMKHSFKPTMYTFIPIIILFGWMTSHLAYYPLVPGEPFTVYADMQPGLPGEIVLSALPELGIDNPVQVAATRVEWLATGGAGEYTLIAKYGENEYTSEILIDEKNYKAPNSNADGAVIYFGAVMEKVHPLPFSLFGWNPGWLGTYILLSIVFSIGMRKIMNIA